MFTELDVDFTENRLSDNIYDPDYTKTLPKVEEENLEEIFQHVKIIFLGAAGVGKTSIIKVSFLPHKNSRPGFQQI